jgi:cysteine desulfurase
LGIRRGTVDPSARRVTPIYLDEQATTRLDPNVRATMEPWWDRGANPHSAHRHGAAAHAAVEYARTQTGALIGAPAETIAFSSGATEADNWALIGAMSALSPTRRRLITLATEHRAVLEPARWLATLGVELTVLEVDGDGLVRLDQLDAALDERVGLVSVMFVNNEIGVVQPVAQIARLARHVGALVHCDAAQAVGKIPVDVDALGVDLLSISGHKFYGPQGIGALYRRSGVDLAPILHGGGQENGRSGTVPVALAVGLGAAARVAGERMKDDAAHVETLWNRAQSGLAGVEWTLNGSATRRWHGNLNARFAGVDGARLLSDVTRGVSLSAGSACADAAGRDSHVLAALGLHPREVRASLRMGWGRFTTADEVEEAVGFIADAVHRQRRVAA